MTKRVSLIKALEADYAKRGVEAIEELRQKHPAKYMRLILSVIRPVLRKRDAE
jgi:ribulose bisphosphate carboxylase small subunit